MSENGIKIIRTQKYKVTTDSNHTFNIAVNPRDQDFSADNPNHEWAVDISSIWTSEGWLYLAAILELYLSPRHRLGCVQPYEAGSGVPGVGYGSGTVNAAGGLHLPHGSRVSILFQRVSMTPFQTWVQSHNEWKRKSL